MLSPVLEELSKEYTGKAKFVAVDVEDAPNTSAQMRIMGTPTVVLFNNKQAVGKVVGFKNKDAFVQLLKQAAQN